MISQTARSCAGLAYELRRQTATDFCAKPLKFGDGTDYTLFVQRRIYLAPMSYSLGYLEAQVALDQRFRLLPGQIVKLGDTDASQLKHIAKTLGRNKPGSRALAFDDGVRRNRGAMYEEFTISRVNVLAEQELLQNIGNATIESARGREAFGNPDLATLTDENDVSKCAADINADRISS